MTARKVSRKMGRPSIYTLELSERICAELACGKSLRTVCKADDMPGLETVFRWLREKTDFRDQYEKAKNECADALVEEIIDISDDGRNDWMEVHDKDGNSTGWKLNGEHIQRSRLRVDVRKWAASKLKPRKYGERLDLNHGIQTDDPIAELIKSVQGTALLPVPHKILENFSADDDLYDDGMN
jgi:hypothetical protein